MLIKHRHHVYIQSARLSAKDGDIYGAVMICKNEFETAEHLIAQILVLETI